MDLLYTGSVLSNFQDIVMGVDLYKCSLLELLSQTKASQY